jgi:hypothetical protein
MDMDMDMDMDVERVGTQRHGLTPNGTPGRRGVCVG